MLSIFASHQKNSRNLHISQWEHLIIPYREINQVQLLQDFWPACRNWWGNHWCRDGCTILCSCLSLDLPPTTGMQTSVHSEGQKLHGCTWRRGGLTSRKYSAVPIWILFLLKLEENVGGLVHVQVLPQEQYMCLYEGARPYKHSWS